MSFNLNKEIEGTINKYIKTLDINPIYTEKILEIKKKFIEEYKNKNYFKLLPKDLILYISDFGMPADLLNLSLSCIDNYDYYFKHAWYKFNKFYYPKSLLTEVNQIRDNIAIDSFYSYILNVSSYDFRIDALIQCENLIIKLSDKMHLLDGGIQEELDHRNTIHDKLLEIYTKRFDIYSTISEYDKEKIENFKYISNECWSGSKTYTNKPKLDIRLYGFNPNIQEEREQGEIKIKWVSGEYNENWDNKWTAPDDFDPYYESDDFWYSFDVTEWVRYRVKPDYC